MGGPRGIRFVSFSKPLHLAEASSSFVASFAQLPDRDLRKDGICIAEGRTVVDRLIESGVEILGIIGTPENADQYATQSGGAYPVYTGTRREIGTLLGFKFHRGLLAAARRPKFPLICSGPGWGLGLTAVQEESNVGTLIRSARAFGTQFIALGPLSGDPFSRKAIRSSVGLVFGAPLVQFESDEEFIRWVEIEKRLLVAADGSAGAHDLEDFVADLEPGGKFAGRSGVIVVGHEFGGHSTIIEKRADLRIRVPMADGIDSLNVAAAGAIILYTLSVVDGRKTGRVSPS